MTGIDRPTGSDEVGPPGDANPDDMTGIDRPTGSDEVGPPGDANPDDMTGIERPLKLEDDFFEGNMNEALYIPVLANDTFTGGELLSFFTFIVVNVFKLSSNTQICNPYVISPSLPEAEGGFSNPEHGAVIEVTEDGLIYMPDTDFCGYDSFVYTINTSTQVDSATVTVHILCDSVTVAGEPDFIEDGTALISLTCNTIMNDPVLKEVPSGDVTFMSYGDHGDCSIKDVSMIMYIPDQGFAGYDEVSSYAIISTQYKVVSFFAC
jgi:hypothetical protein